MLGIDVLEAEGTIDLSVGGFGTQPDIFIEPRLAFLSYNDVRISSIDGYARISDFEIRDVEAVVDVGYTVIGGFPIQAASMSLLADRESIIFVSDIDFDKRRRSRLSATFHPSLQNPELTIEDLTVNLDGAIWRLSQEATIHGGQIWEIRNFLLHDEHAVRPQPHSLATPNVGKNCLAVAIRSISP